MIFDCRTVKVLLLLVFMAAAAVSDIKRFRVSNRMLAAGAAVTAAADLLCGISPDPAALVLLLAFELLLVWLHRFRLIGGADIKLYAILILAFPNAGGAAAVAVSVAAAVLLSLLFLVAAGNRRFPMAAAIFAGTAVAAAAGWLR